MKSLSLQVFLAIILFSYNAAAQPTSDFDINFATTTVKFNDPGNLSRKPADLTYRDVAGQYLWKDDWKPALIIMKTGNPTKMKSVRLNFYSNEIHYMAKEGEMAAALDKVKRVIMYSGDASDSTKVEAVFDIIQDPNTRKNTFAQIMNDGDIQLLKHSSVKMMKERFNPTTTKDEYRFYLDSDYLIRNQLVIKPVKALSKTTVLEALPAASENEAWLASNKNKLKKADDVVEFFNYLNSQNKETK